MKIVGIDLAYAKPIKIAVLSSRGKLLFLSSVEPRATLFETAKAIHEVILPIEGALIAMERVGIYRNRTTGLKLSKLAAVLWALLHESGFVVRQIEPREWQKAAFGKVTDTKKASVEIADKLFGARIPYPIKHDDADALNIAYYACKNSRNILKSKDDI